MPIELITPKLIDIKIEIAIEEADIEQEVKYWESTLIMYVIGGDLSMNAVKQYMMKFLNFVQLPDMIYNEEGYCML